LVNDTPKWFKQIDDSARLACFSNTDDDVLAIVYTPNEDCFFNGDDPIHTIQGIPGLKWFSIHNNNEWGDEEKIDPFHCNLHFYCLVNAKETKVRNYLKYVVEQAEIIKLQPTQLIIPVGDLGDLSDKVIYESLLEDATKAIHKGEYESLKRSLKPLLEIGSAELIQTSALAWMRALLNKSEPSKPWLEALLDVIRTGIFIPPDNQHSEISKDHRLLDTQLAKITSDQQPAKEDGGTTQNKIVDKKSLEIPAFIHDFFVTQLKILNMPHSTKLLAGKVASTQKLLERVFIQIGWDELVVNLEKAALVCIEEASSQPLARSLQQCINAKLGNEKATEVTLIASQAEMQAEPTSYEAEQISVPNRRESERRVSDDLADQKVTTKFLRVDQERIDMLMDLVGELVVAKNALPFLARRAEEEFKVKELSKEIKSLYSVINRLSEELQNAMMSVRMVPVSSVFKRFPRLVRDLSRRLEKNIELVMEGEETEADKNVIESLADPLIHLVRNSLDHGIEIPADRVAAGKPEKGTLTLRAIPHDDQVIIEIIDDGKGIDPSIIKKKAYEKGVINEAQLDSMSDQEAIELIFAAGLSSKDEASDLSGRGVGMDVVRSAVNAAGGSIAITSELNVGSTIKLYLPLSMAVAQVMIIEVDKQVYGVPMDVISETVRVPVESIERVKNNEAIVLRDKLIPLRRLRNLLGLSEAEKDLTEEAVLVVTLLGEEMGLIIDDFHEGIDVIQKPLEGVMSSYPIYAGATLLGDGRVLLILDLKELM
jgi:two-component system chemotaxis sensor kinase CheA